MITQWKKKPVIVEVLQWKGNNAKEIEEFCGYKDAHMLMDNCYIVKENGKFTLYSETAFHEIYERHLVWEDNI